MGVPTTGIEVGRTLDALGRLIEARARLLQVARMPVKPNEPAAFTNARTEAGELAQRIADRIPAIQVQVTGPSDTKSVRLLIDGTPQPSAMLGLPIKVNPGKHQVSVQAEGYTTDTQTLSVSERETRAHKVTLRTGTGTAPNPVPPTPVPPGPAQPAPTPGPLPGPSPVPGPTPTPTPQPDPLPPKGTDPDTSGGGGVSPLLIAGFSIAGAGVLVGAITGGISIARTKSLKKECVDGECPDSVTNDLRSANTLANVSNATFAIAGVGAILGIVGIFVGGDPDASGTAQPQPASVRLEPYFGADVLGLRGRF